MSIHKSFGLRVLYAALYLLCVCVLVQLCGCSCWAAVVVHIKNGLTRCLSFTLPFSPPPSLSLSPSSQTSIPTTLCLARHRVGRVAWLSATQCVQSGSKSSIYRNFGRKPGTDPHVVVCIVYGRRVSFEWKHFRTVAVGGGGGVCGARRGRSHSRRGGQAYELKSFVGTDLSNGLRVSRVLRSTTLCKRRQAGRTNKRQWQGELSQRRGVKGCFETVMRTGCACVWWFRGGEREDGVCVRLAIQTAVRK